MSLDLSHLGVKYTKKKIEEPTVEAILLSRVSSK